MFNIPMSLLKRQKVRQDRGIVVDDTVGNEAAAFIPNLLIILGFKTERAEVSIRNRSS